MSSVDLEPLDEEVVIPVSRSKVVHQPVVASKVSILDYNIQAFDKTFLIFYLERLLINVNLITFLSLLVNLRKAAYVDVITTNLSMYI